MKCHDVVHGEWEIPDFLLPLIWTPEFQRLQRVRLININSPTLAALSDATRYSHTLGVIRLALENSFLGLGEKEARAFLAALVMHDAATPAFAHLFEYFLRERFDWDHESAVSDLIKNDKTSAGVHKQIYRSLEPNFRKACKTASVEFELVLEFLSAKHEFSKLIFGSVDFDNLDNVVRMATLLGGKPEYSAILSIAKHLGVDAQGRVTLPILQSGNIEAWSRMRNYAYERLVYDWATVARQAVLSNSIEWALDKGLLSEEDWHYDDEHLISVLLKVPHCKKRLIQDFFGQPPQLVLLLRLQDLKHTLFTRTRREIVDLIEQFLATASQNVGRTYGYVFRDHGAFSKRVEFFDAIEQSTWSVGVASKSLVLYGFSRNRERAADPQQEGRRFLEWIASMS